MSVGRWLKMKDKYEEMISILDKELSHRPITPRTLIKIILLALEIHESKKDIK
jgi:hypothetical protein